MPRTSPLPASANFKALPVTGNADFSHLARAHVSEEMAKAAIKAPRGRLVAWGIAFRVGRPLVACLETVTVKLSHVRKPWLVLLHTSDRRPLETNEHGFHSPMDGAGRLGEHAVDYVFVYADGTEVRAAIRRRYQVGMFSQQWGENCLECVSDGAPRPLPSHGREVMPLQRWGSLQSRATANDSRPWTNWLWAWKNPYPGKALVALRIEAKTGSLVLSGLAAGTATDHPLRWQRRRKAVLTLPPGVEFDPILDPAGNWRHLRLDMGQVISVTPRLIYEQRGWPNSYNNKVPAVSPREVVVEYAAHDDARFHLPGGRTVPVARLKGHRASRPLAEIIPATRRVTLRAVEKGTGEIVPVKLHVHGRAGEYLAPFDRHRIINPDWFQDYSVDFSHLARHHCTYIPGQTRIDLPLGRVYVEVSKGFEIRPVRKVVQVTGKSEEIVVEIEKVLRWRERGWVSADTHVHFLSPSSALLEGSGEGVNVVNLLASQWGELMTNVGDFDGRTTFGSREAGGGDGEHLVRVGTENRQHIMGHISLLGYEGSIIAPMTTGGPGESAIGDPVGCLLSDWARRCKEQNGVVVIPHFPNPRAENAAAIVAGDVDGVEMTSWGSLYGGISPYSLSDWYRYLNCGCMVAAVGGTDKMSATTAVGTVRTYARLEEGQELTYDTWKEAMRRGHTFVTYGPLMEFSVDGRPAGSRIKMSRSGGTVDVSWRVASVTVPVSRVELVVNGEIRHSVSAGPWEVEGTWSVRLDRSSWMALLVRGHYEDKPEIIAAHSSPVMVEVEGSAVMAAADALTILEQIEGALAYLDTVGTRAETAQYKRMRLVLTAAHRKLHNRLHQDGKYHRHTPTQNHPRHGDGH